MIRLDRLKPRLVVPSQLTAMTIVGRAVLAGVGGGLCAALLLATAGRNSIEAAIAFEATLPADLADSRTPVEIARNAQVGGGLVAVVLFGALNGILFGTVLASVRHRLGLADDFRRSVALALAAFLCLALFPAIKYPANPPGVGDPETITTRTVAYLTLLAAGVTLTIAGTMLYRQLRLQLDQPTTIAITALLTLAGFVILGALWPANPDQIPEGFPPDLLWTFRLESLASLAVQWAALGLGTGWLLSRQPTPTPSS